MDHLAWLPFLVDVLVVDQDRHDGLAAGAASDISDLAHV
jgi:hypothetical protein